MSHTVITLECPGCGASATTAQRVCGFCKGPIVISTFNSVASMAVPLLHKYADSYKGALGRAPDNLQLRVSIAMCYLKLRLYDRALPAFERAIEENFDESEAYIYAAACLLKGQKPFLASRETIDRVLSLINAGIAIEPKGIYLYFAAFIKYDYHARKGFKTDPDYVAILTLAREAGFSDSDVSALHELLSVPRPAALA
jgi:tetratricopeptide (TPR) repeat protein